jgi:hypothetical protein
MLIIPPSQFPPRRRTRFPVSVNRILNVAHVSAVNRLNVIIRGNLIDLDYLQALEAFDGTTWRTPVGGNFDVPPLLALAYPVHVNTATQWRIVDPSVWVFEDGRPLMPPYSGTIG